LTWDRGIFYLPSSLVQPVLLLSERGVDQKSIIFGQKNTLLEKSKIGEVGVNQGR